MDGSELYGLFVDAVMELVAVVAADDIRTFHGHDLHQDCCLYHLQD